MSGDDNVIEERELEQQGNLVDKIALVSESNTCEVARKLFSENPKMEMGAVAVGHGDQVAVAFRALQLGVEIDQWDLSFKEQLGLAVDTYGAEASAVWFLSQSFIALKDQGKEFSLENIMQMIGGITGMKGEEIRGLFQGHLESQGAVEALLRKTLGVGLGEILDDEEGEKRFTRLADPLLTKKELAELSEQERNVAKIPGELGRMRDQLGIRRIKEHVEKGRNVFVSCGRTHARGLERCLQAIDEENFRVYSREDDDR